jgi:hypothetical protein
MTPEEINALIDEMLEKFRAFVVEELQKHYNAGNAMSPGEVHYMLKLFEDNEMVKMFNEDKIPQDKFRVFLRKYLRLWFELFAEKITEVGGKITTVDNVSDLPTDGSVTIAVVKGADGKDGLYYWDGTQWRRACECVEGKIPTFDNVGDLPTDGSVTIAVVKGADGKDGLYFWDGTTWRKACECEPGEIPTFDNVGDLPTDGSISIAVVKGADGKDGLYYWDGTEWVKVVSEKDLDDAVSAIYGDISNYINNILDSHGFKDKGKTYHDTVLEIVNAIPPMNEGDRYLLNVVDNGVAETVVQETEVLQIAIVPTIAGTNSQSPNFDSVYMKNGTAIQGWDSVTNNKHTRTPGQNSMRSLTEYNGELYAAAEFGKTLAWFNFNTKQYEGRREDGVKGYPIPYGISVANGLYLFDGKMWFNSGSGNSIRWSYINSSGEIVHGTPFSGSVAGFDTTVTVYQNKLYIAGSSGLWTLSPGTTAPVHVASSVFDSAGETLSADVCDGKLWVLAGDAYSRRILSYNGSAATEYNIEDAHRYRKLLTWDNELFVIPIQQVSGGNTIKWNGNAFVAAYPVALVYDCMVWDNKLWMIGYTTLTSLTKSGESAIVYDGFVVPWADPNGGLTIFRRPPGQMIIERISYKTIGGSSGNSVEIKIVGMDENGQYDEPFEEGHRVVVKDSPTGFSREYGIRDGELMDTDSSDNSAIRGNVDTYADLRAIDTSDVTLGIKIGDGYIVEKDETHDDNSAIYTWDGTEWNFTHLWQISLELKYGTYNVTSTSFAFNKFATKNENAEEFDVLEVSFSGNCNVSIAAASGKSGDTRIMIFNVAAGQTVNLSFGFANKLVDGAELSLKTGMHVASLIRASAPILNIAPYGS